jgi:hypothetical protein
MLESIRQQLGSEPRHGKFARARSIEVLVKELRRVQYEARLGVGASF